MPYLLLSLALLANGDGVTVDLGAAVLRLDDRGRLAELTDKATRTNYAVAGTPFCRLETRTATRLPASATAAGDRVTIAFEGGARLVLRVAPGDGFAVFTVVALDGIDPAEVEWLRLADLRVRELPTVAGVINRATNGAFNAAVMATTINVQGAPLAARTSSGDKPGVTSDFRPVADDVKEGQRAALFEAESTLDTKDGWSVRYGPFARAVDLTGLKAIKAWIHGDGQGELLKFQLSDGKQARDQYLPITFTGWREVTLTEHQYEIDLANVRGLHYYYNGLPAKTRVACRIDSVRAVVAGPEGDREIFLEGFENGDSPLWGGEGVALRATVHRQHGLTPAGFGVIAGPAARFAETVAAFELAAGLPSPRFAGEWGRDSLWAKRSYLFITGFGEADTDEVIAWAKRGGFGMILIGGGCWHVSHGHHEINPRFFPDGLPSLQRSVAKMKAAGLRVGLHFLAPAVYPNDPYATPKPDPRLVKDRSLTLAEGLDAKADFVPTTTAPTGFPTEDGGYTGSGTILQIGDEMISYAGINTTAPYGFTGCRRGFNGTVAAAHAAGDQVDHLLRSYGYFLYDLDSTLADEVIGNVCRTANAIEADMLYFDGSERLQGDHWYYNAKLQSKYHQHLKNKNTFLQGSSYSHYSWHMIPRTASADGHGDLKGYLDERSAHFGWYDNNLMPLDIGWYYLYDPELTADSFDYILQKCLGWGASLSLQTNPKQLREHPEAGAIFDLVNAYERLRLSGKITAEVREKLREPKREYRLLRDPLRLRRTVYGEWAESSPEADAVELDAAPAVPDARLGFDLICGGLSRPGPHYQSAEALTLETFASLKPYIGDRQNEFETFVIGTGKAGSTSGGVTAEFALEDGAPGGGKCARFTATSTLPTAGGWASIGRRLDPPLDLTWHQGLGFWLKGDGHGGAFKLQVRQNENATDYYTTNDFSGWRYLQLVRPDKPSPLPMDYTAVNYLIFYYNNLPAKSKVSCCIAGVKVLRALDTAQITDPRLRLGDQTITFKATLNEGDRLRYLPPGPPLLYAKGGATKSLPAPAPLTLTAATKATIAPTGATAARLKARLVQDGSEEILLPEDALKAPPPELRR